MSHLTTLQRPNSVQLVCLEGADVVVPTTFRPPL